MKKWTWRAVNKREKRRTKEREKKRRRRKTVELIFTKLYPYFNILLEVFTLYRGDSLLSSLDGTVKEEKERMKRGNTIKF